MDATTILGFIAGFLTTVAFIPQVVKIWKTRSAKDVSLPTFAAFSVGVGLWLAYGFMKQEPPMILWNGVTLLLAMAILGMKIKFG